MIKLKKETRDDLKELEQEIELFDVPALFIDQRISKDNLPDGIYCYELRGSDDDPGYPVTIENDVTVNYVATVLTPIPIPLPKDTQMLKLGEGLNFVGGMLSIQEYLKKVKDMDLDLLKQRMEKAIAMEESIMEKLTSSQIQRLMKAYEKAKKELMQYASIGSVEECRQAMRLQTPQHLTIKQYQPLYCPNCGTALYSNCGDGYYVYPYDLKRCLQCGQRIEIN